MKKLKILLLSFPLWGLGGFATAQNVNKIEYFIDADPGYGAGTDVPISAATTVTANFNVPVSSVTDGFHTLSIRGRDANNAWSVTGIRPFYKETIPNATLPNITAMEYFIDADPGYGLGTAVSFTAGSNVSTSFTASLSSVSNGFHLLSIRAKDANNKWSVVGVRPFYREEIPNATLPNITAMEYFIDADPGYGLGTAVSFTAGSNVSTSFTASLSSVSNGFHLLSIRAKDANNKWSVVGVRPFYKEEIPNATLPNITAMEYFIDADPGFGAGTAMSFTAGNNVATSFTASLSAVSNGFHNLSIRAKDANNKWSVVGVRPFYKEEIPNVTLPNITAMEYFVDADPGYGAGTAVTFTAASPVSQTFTVNLGSLSLTNGNHKLSIRAKDANNKWSVVGIRDFAVQDNIIVIGVTPPIWCRTTAFNIPFTVTGTYTAGNIFTAQLSNSSGTFTSPTTLGTLTSTTAGTIAATIPNTVSLGSNYQIRVISSTPSVTNSPTKAVSVVAVCPPPCAGTITLASPTDDISTGTVVKEVNASTGTISATNKITGTANVTYRAGKSITLDVGFKADNGTVFLTQFGGCN
jgi:hypothetical protein